MKMNCMSNLMFTFVKSTKISELTSKSKLMDEMKDRIRQLMLAQHMNQQSFAEVLDISPASLSSIFNDTATTEIYTLHIVGSVRCV